MLLSRHWIVLERPGHAGRLLPDTEMEMAESRLDSLRHAPDYATFLRGTNMAVDTEINLQLGEYTLKNHALQALPAHINHHTDFMQIFGAKRESNPIQCVEVQNSSHRMWVRLIGLRHDIQLWDVEPRQPSRQPPLTSRR